MSQKNKGYYLQWKDADLNGAKLLYELRDDLEYSDVTLGCSDSKGSSLNAHRLILSRISPVFKDMLKRTGQGNKQHVGLFMRGMSYRDLSTILDFIYLGEVNIQEEHVASFFSAAADLKIQGLSNNQFANNPQFAILDDVKAEPMSARKKTFQSFQSQRMGPDRFSDNEVNISPISSKKDQLMMFDNNNESFLDTELNNNDFNNEDFLLNMDSGLLSQETDAQDPNVKNEAMENISNLKESNDESNSAKESTEKPNVTTDPSQPKRRRKYKDPSLYKHIEPEDLNTTEPHQPNNGLFSKNHQGRIFNATWYSKFPWVEFSEVAQRAYCFPCRVHGHNYKGRLGEGDAFTTVGFTNWKNGLPKLGMHEKSNMHRIATEIWHVNFQKFIPF